MKASVIIPAHNEESCIEKTLSSAKHADVETIVVCNGCSDNTAEIARKFADKVFVLDEANVSKARNFGARMASSDRFIFVDADIVLDENVLDKIIDSEYSIGTAKVKPDVNKLTYQVAMWGKSYVQWLGCCTGLIFCDKDLFEKVGKFEESCIAGEDGALLRAAKSQGKYGVVNGYVFNNMRRFEKLGISRVAWFWIKHHLIKADKDKYEPIR